LRISSPRGASATSGGVAGDERVLRAKYLDWCSARIAERFLELTPDEIYELAQRASREEELVSRGARSASGAPVAEADVESFRALVARVTGVLASTVPIPPFEDWAVAYRASPASFDHELLGFWKEVVRGRRNQ
jgi:hypothetical protein